MWWLWAQLDPFQYAITARTQNARSWQNVHRTKNIFLYFFIELKTYHPFFIILTNTTLSTSLILVVGSMRVMWTSQWALLTVEFLWFSDRASEHGIRGTEVRFLMGTQNFFFVSRLWQDEKHLSPVLYQAQILLSLLFYLQGIDYSTIIFSSVLRILI